MGFIYFLPDSRLKVSMFAVLALDGPASTPDADRAPSARTAPTEAGAKACS